MATELAEKNRSTDAYEAERILRKELKDDAPFDCGYVAAEFTAGRINPGQSPADFMTREAAKEWIDGGIESEVLKNEDIS